VQAEEADLRHRYAAKAEASLAVLEVERRRSAAALKALHARRTASGVALDDE
jgi:hypothetical protein